MSTEVTQILNRLYDEYPAEPDWAEIKTLIFSFDNPTAVMLDFIKVMYLYAEDFSAFETLIATLGE